MKIVEKDFFERSVLDVAPDLLGKHLVRKFENGEIHTSLITEVEAYDGEEDLACHASKGRTPRTDVMYGEAGVWYVYLVYGMHHMLNVVTGPQEYPAAVLLRGLEKVSGPGRLTKRLGIDMNMNKKRVSEKSGLWIEEGEPVSEVAIERTPRIGVSYAGEWALRPYRFLYRS